MLNNLITSKKQIVLAVFVSLVTLCGFSRSVFSASEAQPTLALGADVFKQRCILCHGEEAKGNGVLPLKLKNYPNTNLVGALSDRSRGHIKYAVVYGGTEGEMSAYMPPMGNDLTWTETESVIDFVSLISTDYPKFLHLLNQDGEQETVSVQQGRDVYDRHCALCHGDHGTGDGRLSKVIKLPPPFNLTLSRLADEDLAQIISRGGSAVGRSNKMPPWGEQLTEQQILSVIGYLKLLRAD